MSDAGLVRVTRRLRVHTKLEGFALEEIARPTPKLGRLTKLVAVRLLTVKSAVGAMPPLFSRVVTRLDGRHLGAQGAEVGDEGVAGVALTFAPAVAGDLEGAAVAQDGLAGEGLCGG